MGIFGWMIVFFAVYWIFSDFDLDYNLNEEGDEE